jgi:hypothetical protein
MSTTTSMTETAWPPPVDDRTVWTRRWVGANPRDQRWVELRTVRLGDRDVDVDREGRCWCWGCGDLVSLTEVIAPASPHRVGSYQGGAW